MGDPTINEVRSFWEQKPLFADEVDSSLGLAEQYEVQRQIFAEDAFAGEIDNRLFPEVSDGASILDLGCGPGFWTAEFAKRGYASVTGADLTERAIELARERLDFLGLDAVVTRQNAEATDFPDNTFTHVHCQGVIHHTTSPKNCVKEIARVLQPNGTATIAVYYQNFFIRNWWLFSWVPKVLGYLGGGLSGRGREGIFTVKNVDELIRHYDGADNPIGYSYDRSAFLELLEPELQVEETYLHYIPVRALPFSLPKFIHRFLDKNFGLMIYARCRKKGEAR